MLLHSAESTNIADAEEFSSHLTQEIINMGKRINSNQYNCQYSPRKLRIAMAIWSHSKTAYRYLRESNLVMLPCPRTLYMKKEKGRIHQGFNQKLYSRLFDEFVEPNKSRNISGHLMVDEMKLKSGVFLTVIPMKSQDLKLMVMV